MENVLRLTGANNSKTSKEELLLIIDQQMRQIIELQDLVTRKDKEIARLQALIPSSPVLMPRLPSFNTVPRDHVLAEEAEYVTDTYSIFSLGHNNYDHQITSSSASTISDIQKYSLSLDHNNDDSSEPYSPNINHPSNKISISSASDIDIDTNEFAESSNLAGHDLHISQQNVQHDNDDDDDETIDDEPDDISSDCNQAAIELTIPKNAVIDHIDPPEQIAILKRHPISSSTKCKRIKRSKIFEDVMDAGTIIENNLSNLTNQSIVEYILNKLKDGYHKHMKSICLESLHVEELTKINQMMLKQQFADTTATEYIIPKITSIIKTSKALDMVARYFRSVIAVNIKKQYPKQYKKQFSMKLQISHTDAGTYVNLYHFIHEHYRDPHIYEDIHNLVKIPLFYAAITWHEWRQYLSKTHRPLLERALQLFNQYIES